MILVAIAMGMALPVNAYVIRFLPVHAEEDVNVCETICVCVFEFICGGILSVNS